MLTKGEIGELTTALVAASGFITDLRRSTPIASHVQYPKIPSILSESIAAHAIIDGILLKEAGPFERVSFGGRTADIVASGAPDGPLRIETKASGAQQFATFGPKDYAADYLLWMLFEDFFRTGQPRSVEVLVLHKPGERLAMRTNRVTVNQLRSAWAGHLPVVTLALPLKE